MRRTRRIITFEAEADAEALALAKLGLSSAYIKHETGLSEGQITYRLSKAKRLEKHDSGYRVAWRNGQSHLLRSVKNDLLAVLMRDIKRDLPKLVDKPEAQTVKVVA